MARLIKQGYYSASTYIDSIVGKIVQQIDNNTMLVLLGDHGWSLGEHGEWCKMSNFEEAVRVPLIFVPPGQLGSFSHFDVTRNILLDHQYIPSKLVDNFVELVDLFPSIVDLAGLPKVPACTPETTQTTLLCTEGRSWARLVTEPDPYWQDVAFSQYPRPSIYPRYDSDLPREKDIQYMGYSVRWRQRQEEEGWRCTVWMGFKALPVPAPDITDIVGIELYDHQDDEGENSNLAKDKGQIARIQECFDFITKKLEI